MGGKIYDSLCMYSPTRVRYASQAFTPWFTSGHKIAHDTRPNSILRYWPDPAPPIICFAPHISSAKAESSNHQRLIDSDKQILDDYLRLYVAFEDSRTHLNIKN